MLKSSTVKHRKACLQKVVLAYIDSFPFIDALWGVIFACNLRGATV